MFGLDAVRLQWNKKIKKSGKKIRQLFIALVRRSLSEAENDIPPISAIAIFGLLAYYFVWTQIFVQPYDNLELRLVGSLLCLGLMLKNVWPKAWEPYFPLYWYVSILYILPFFSTFLLFKNNYATVPLLVSMMSLFLLTLLVDWINLNILFFLGMLLAWIAYAATTPHPQPPTLYMPYLSTYAFTILTGSILNYKSSLLAQKKLEGMAAVSGTIAHELRTPLLGIQSGARGLKRYLPILFEGYRLARDHDLPVPKIRTAHYQTILPVLDRIERESKYANSIIDMLLMNVKKIPSHQNQTEWVSIHECINDALLRYPFQTADEMTLVKWKQNADFMICGEKIMITHVLFNLLKNAIHFIAQAGKGEIYLWTRLEEDQNQLYFKDTGAGIAANVLPHLFDRFFTTTISGTGIGLSFCKMVMDSLGGSITCHSEENEYTEFVLTFPAVPRDLSLSPTESSPISFEHSVS